MALDLFGITHDFVRRHFFPTIGAFSPSSKPTDATVTENISMRAGELCARLIQKSIVPDTISGAPATYPVSYAWCQKTLSLASAIDTIDQVQQGSSGAQNQKTKWLSELKVRYDDLEKRGWLALGDPPKPGQSGTGPRTYIGNNNLTTQQSSDMSPATPTFKSEDLL